MKMRTACLTVLFLAGLCLSSCSTQDDRARRNEPAAREAGREAYRASEAAKRGARDAARDLHDAEKQFRKGWSEEKHRNPPPPKHEQ